MNFSDYQLAGQSARTCPAKEHSFCKQDPGGPTPVRRACTLREGIRQASAQHWTGFQVHHSLLGRVSRCERPCFRTTRHGRTSAWAPRRHTVGQMTPSPRSGGAPLRGAGAVSSVKPWNEPHRHGRLFSAAAASATIKTVLQHKH